MRIPNAGRGLRSALILVLCALFFLLAKGLGLLSREAYRGEPAAADEHYTHRTALSYLVNQLRRGDVAGGVSVRAFGDGDALCLSEGGYVTLLYCYDGQLRELYTEEGLDLSPEDGVAVLPLDGLTVTMEEGLITFTAESGGTSYPASLSLRSTPLEEVAP